MSHVRSCVLQLFHDCILFIALICIDDLSLCLTYTLEVCTKILMSIEVVQSIKSFKGMSKSLYKYFDFSNQHYVDLSWTGIVAYKYSTPDGHTYLPYQCTYTGFRSRVILMKEYMIKERSSDVMPKCWYSWCEHEKYEQRHTNRWITLRTQPGRKTVYIHAIENVKERVCQLLKRL